MKRAPNTWLSGSIPAFVLACFASIVILVFSLPALGVQFDSGNFQGSLDTTLSYGVNFRVEDPDGNLVGYLKENGKAYSENVDDGTLNYDTGIVSNTAKITSELEVHYLNFGAFFRGTGFYDFENMDSDREYIPLTDDAKDLAGSDVRLLDAFLTVDFDAGNMPVSFRVGEQMLSWGESTYIANSINTINRVDVAAYRLPGSELKEALVPEGMAYINIGATENTTVEAFYEYDWEQTDIDPSGSYFSTNDFAGDGGSKVMLGFGDWSDQGTMLPTPLGTPALDPDFMGVGRAPTVEADDGGQFGLALRVFTPYLNDTEFGFYFINYHSHVPIISGISGTQAGFGNAVAAATTINSYSNPLSPTYGNAADSVSAGVTAGMDAGATATDAMASSSGVLAVAGGIAAAGGDPAAYISAYITDLYSQTARYFTEYPEDIRLLGISFNTDLGATGIAVQGEVSYRMDMPLQVDDVELLFAALTPLAPINPAVLQNQLRPGGVGFEEIISGYIERDVSQFQTTLTKILGPTLGADSVTLVGEAGWTHVHDMPAKDVLRLNGPGTFTSGDSFHSSAYGLHAGKDAEPASAFADADSWGYRVAIKPTFNSVMGLVNLSPRVAWQHDVSGVSPGPGGNFLEGRKALTFGLNAEYQNRWEVDVSYTSYFGAGRYNLISDRNFIGASVKYSF